MKRRLSALLLAMLLFAPAALAAHEPRSYPYTASVPADTPILREALEGAEAAGQLRAGDTAYITAYNGGWAKVIKGSYTGYVPLSALGEVLTAAGEPADPPAEGVLLTPSPEPGFTMDAANFLAKFYASALYKATEVYTRPSEDAEVAFRLNQYQKVDVGQVSGDWCLISLNGSCGYVPTARLFKWDRYDPYAGPIPNLDVWPNMLWTNKSVDLIGTKSGKLIYTVNPGAAMACGEKDGQGRYLVPIEREYAYVSEDDVAYILPVTPWEEAQSGDLLSVMSTFYALGIHTLQFRGRCWNLRVGGTYITGTVLQPGQEYNQNHTIGPYTKSSNYQIAPTTGENGYGGGTCQVNSTFYIATVQLPLHIIHRQVHQNIGMHYCKIGLDSSVASSETNTLIMRNTLPYAIRYHYFVSDSVLTCAIFRD